MGGVGFAGRLVVVVSRRIGLLADRVLLQVRVAGAVGMAARVRVGVRMRVRVRMRVMMALEEEGVHVVEHVPGKVARSNHSRLVHRDVAGHCWRVRFNKAARGRVRVQRVNPTGDSTSEDRGRGRGWKRMGKRMGMGMGMEKKREQKDTPQAATSTS